MLTAHMMVKYFGDKTRIIVREVCHKGVDVT